MGVEQIVKQESAQKADPGVENSATAPAGTLTQTCRDMLHVSGTERVSRVKPLAVT